MCVLQSFLGVLIDFVSDKPSAQEKIIARNNNILLNESVITCQVIYRRYIIAIMIVYSMKLKMTDLRKHCPPLHTHTHTPAHKVSHLFVKEQNEN